jgi:uncharacterized membrane protein
MNRNRLWLSHHRQEQLHRTYSVGGARVCARCLGVYPVMFAAIAAQIARRAPLAWAGDPFWTIGLLLPALIDWCVGQRAPHLGANWIRTATGVAAGAALGRSLYIHLHTPFPVWLVAQVALVTVAALAVILAAYGRRPTP